MEEMKIKKESILIYQPWYELMKSWNHKRFSIAIRALLEYGFYNIPLEKQELPEDIYLFLNTITPQIDSNFKKYLNGVKGSKHGSKGGRPHKSTEEDLNAMETPKGIPSKTPNVNENENVKENVYVNGNASGAGPGSEILHRDTEFFIPYFFFNKKIKRACYEAERFVNFYDAKDWRVKESVLDTNEKRLNKVVTWDPQAESGSRNPGFLVVWRKFYAAFPPALRPRMLEDRVEYKLLTGVCELTAPKAVCLELDRLLKENVELRKAWDEWSHKRTLTYKAY